MSSFIRWLDYSEEDQRRIRELLKGFADSDTVDDLGIGTIRDAISNALFPGTSVIQTRARYFLFVPWIFRQAERRHPTQAVAKANDMERFLIDALKRGEDQDGLIGRVAGRAVKTLPSAIYWSGLQRYDILTVPGLSIRQLGRYVASSRGAMEQEDELADRAPSIWSREIPAPPEDFFKFARADFDLMADEAEWLCERFVSIEAAEGRPNLLAGFARDIRRGRPNPSAPEVWYAPLPSGTADSLVDMVRQGCCFSCAVHGAALVYNLMLAEASAKARFELPDVELEPPPFTSPDLYRGLIEEWVHAPATRELAAWAADIHGFWDRLSDARAGVAPRTRRFVESWAKILASHHPESIADSGLARSVIRDRELEHKRGQARLANQKRLLSWRGYSGTAPLNYRWPLVTRLLRDIAAGLAMPEADNAGA